MTDLPAGPLPVRIWHPVILGGGAHRVVVLSFGETFCSVRLVADCRGLTAADAALARPYVARPDELHAVDEWEAAQAANEGASA